MPGKYDENTKVERSGWSASTARQRLGVGRDEGDLGATRDERRDAA